MAGGGGGGEGEPEFQIAPMVDVLLVLLIFFMSITSAQVLKIDKSIKLPIATDALKKDSTRSESVINVRWDAATKKATYVIDDRIYPELPDLTKALVEAKKAGEAKVAHGTNPTFRAVIRGDREASAVSVSRAMNCAAEAGISDIAFSTTNKD
ncbi:MAG: biopolymer transporter ExbD [Chthoniobacteraceae bacterium]|nr:biopolymer transporter ExbD [Chthoniobacteraceae bacterium]